MIEMERFLDEIRERVAEHGFTCVAVGDYPGFTYTVGASQMPLGCELVVIGPSPLMANQVLVNCLQLKTVKPGAKSKKVLQNARVVFRECLPSMAAQYAKVAFRLYGDVKVMQVVLPDPSGKLPGESGYDDTYMQWQPHLWERYVMPPPERPQ